MMGFKFLFYLNNTDEKTQMHSTDDGKMLKIGNPISGFEKTFCWT